MGVRFMIQTTIATTLAENQFGKFFHSTWHVLFLQCACYSFQQLHSDVGNNYMNISFEFHVLQVFTEFI
jgi:hypothetical protein